MAKKQDRSSRYYKKRLQTEYPAVHADLLAGKYRSVRAAALAAGLVKERSTFQELKSAWNKATKSEKTMFANWLRGQSAKGGASSPTTKYRAVATAGGYLLPWARTRVLEVRGRRNLIKKQVMLELGLNPLDASMWTAIINKGGSRVRADLISALEKWLHDNRHI